MHDKLFILTEFKAYLDWRMNSNRNQIYRAGCLNCEGHDDELVAGRHDGIEEMTHN
jgi:hypothetical protein